MYVFCRCACAHIAQLGRETRSGFRDNMLNDFIDTTFYGRTLSSFSSLERTFVAIFFLRWPNEHVTSKLLYRSKSTNYQPRKKAKQISLSFSLTTWEHSLFSSLFKHFTLSCFHLGTTNLQGLTISQH